MSTTRYAIIGTGAVGGYYGARLAHHGHPVDFVARSDISAIRRDGLSVSSPDGDFSIATPSVHESIADLPACDIYMICVKGTGNRILLREIAAVPNGATVLLMQNGFGAEPDFAERLPKATLLGGLAFLCANKTGPGRVEHLDYGRIRVAEFRPNYAPAGHTEAAQVIAQDFDATGIGADVEADLLLARWKKLVWNVPFNGLSVAYGRTTNEIMANSNTRDAAYALMEEVAAGASALGREISSSFLDKNMDMTAKMTPYKTSMMLDYERKQPLELELIYGNAIAAGTAAGALMPRMSALYAQVQELDARNRA